MDTAKLSAVAELMETFHTKGLRISYDEDELVVKFPKNTTVDQSLVQMIRDNKDNILAYLGQYLQKGSGILEEIGATVNKIEHEESIYFKVSPTQVYWLDDNADADYKSFDPTHGAITLIYKATGHLNTNAFWDAVVVVANRHESLRSTFRKIDGSYYMKVAKENTYSHVELIDLQAMPPEKKRVEDLVRFRDHRFDLEKGPLFLCRIVHTAQQEYFLSVKIHHVIADTWSANILLSDLLHAYVAINDGREPLFPQLKYQYKEYLSFLNNYAGKHYDAHKRYWKSLYQSLPGRLKIPGARQLVSHPMEIRICKKAHFEYQPLTVSALYALARTYEASLFVVLQATFKAFMFCRSGQPDILAGTFLFGRDFAGTDNQIGCYAKTRWIRTLMDEKDSLHDIIRKVKQSNADMREYWAYPLSDMLNSALFASKATEDFWKINMQFTDETEYNAGERSLQGILPTLDVQFAPVDFGSVNLMPIDMQLFFKGEPAAVMLEVQYDSSLYEAAVIEALFREYFRFLEKMVGNRYRAIMELTAERPLQVH